MKMSVRLAFLALASPIFLTSCGGGDDSPAPGPAPPPPSGLTVSERIAAAKATAADNPMCTDALLGPYYWEVGDASGIKASGTTGSSAPTATTPIWVYSASKWLYAANVVQKHGVRDEDVPFLNFTSGYTNFGNAPFCLPNNDTTVEGCLVGRDGQDPATVGKFYYDSGHMQHHAANFMGLGPADNAALAADLNNTVGDFGFSYTTPQLAAGVVVTPAGYGQFLRAMLRGDLALGAVLGTHKVCADPSVCPGAIPDVVRPETWYYSLGHWVEDDPDTGDHAFSSPGGGGFYPWIDHTKTYYGMVARVRPTESDAGYHSAQCGRLIRQAWVKGKEVTSTTPSPS